MFFGIGIAIATFSGLTTINATLHECRRIVVKDKAKYAAKDAAKVQDICPEEILEEFSEALGDLADDEE